MVTSFDRRTEDVGNILAFEHINTAVPDQRIATLFYVAGLGFTRDPYMQAGVDNMWINVGRSQFHLPTGEAQLIPGRAGIVVPDRDALLRRLEKVSPRLKDTQFK